MPSAKPKATGRATKRSKKTKPAVRKARSTQADLTRRRLAEKRQEILDLYQHDLKVGQKADDDGAQDIVDLANNAYNREIMFSLSTGERDQLLEIESALERLDSGDYGDCVHCRAKIPAARLRAVPWARYCIDCQEAVEDGLIDDS